MSWGSHIMLPSFMRHHLYFFLCISLPFSKYCWVWVVGLLICFHFRFLLLIHSWTEIRFYSKLIIWIGKPCLAWFAVLFGHMARPSRRAVTRLTALCANRATRGRWWRRYPIISLVPGHQEEKVMCQVGHTDHKRSEDSFCYRSIIWGAVGIF